MMNLLLDLPPLHVIAEKEDLTHTFHLKNKNIAYGIDLLVAFIVTIYHFLSLILLWDYNERRA